MDVWKKHAVGWALIAVGGVAGYVLFEHLDNHILKGLGFALATLLIDVGVLFVHEDLKRSRSGSDRSP